MKRYLIQEKNLEATKINRVILVAKDLTHLLEELTFSTSNQHEYTILGTEIIKCYRCKIELAEIELNNEREVCAHCVSRGH